MVISTQVFLTGILLRPGVGWISFELGHVVKKTSCAKVCAINRYDLLDIMFEVAAQNPFMSGSSVWAKANVGTAANIGDAQEYVRLIGSQSQSLTRAQCGGGLKVYDRGGGELEPDLCSENR
jgi:hypothetical protein